MTLSMTRTANKRKSYDERTGRSSRAGQIALKSALGHFDRKFTTNDYGDRVQIFPSTHRATNDDIRQWLSGNRVVDRYDVLEFCPGSTVDWCVRQGFLKPDPDGRPYFWVTVTAAAQFNLPELPGTGFAKVPTSMTD